MNTILYETVLDSIAVDTTEARYIEKHFGGADPNGKALLEYVLKYGNPENEPAQIAFKAKLQALTIAPNATAKQIDSAPGCWKEMNS
eukprot:7339538-Prymnesium_polylepis.2